MGPEPTKCERVTKELYESVKDKLPNTLFQKNRARFINLFKQKVKCDSDNHAVALFKGASEVPHYSSDCGYPEYQEAYIYYLFGVTEMDCYGFLDITNEKAILFVPKLDALYKIWMTVMTREDFQSKYEVEVRYMGDLEEFMATECSPANNVTVYVNHGVNSDSKQTTWIPDGKYLEGLKVDRESMHDILAEARTVKNDEEIMAMRIASQITVEGHVDMMQKCKAGMRESQLESIFHFYGQMNYAT